MFRYSQNTHLIGVVAGFLLEALLLVLERLDLLLVLLDLVVLLRHIVEQTEVVLLVLDERANQLIDVGDASGSFDLVESLFEVLSALFEVDFVIEAVVAVFDSVFQSVLTVFVLFLIFAALKKSHKTQNCLVYNKTS